MSYHVTQFYQAFPRVSTASDKRWGEKAWVQSYTMCTTCVSHLLELLQDHTHCSTLYKLHLLHTLFQQCKIVTFNDSDLEVVTRYM